MKPVLRHGRTGLYFQGGASWTCEVDGALVYRDVEAALDAAYTSRVAGLELNVLLFDDPRYTLRLSLDEWFGEPAGLSRRSLARRAPADNTIANETLCSSTRRCC